MSRFDTDFKLAKRVTLNIACFYTTSYLAADDGGKIARAIDLLDMHNISLNIWPDNGGQKGGGNTIHDNTPIPNNKDAYEALRRICDRMVRGSGLVVCMPVVFTRFAESGYAITPQAFKNYTPGCLVSSHSTNKDCVDLLHEMGHGALDGTVHDHLSGDEHRTNIMCEADGRSTIYRYQVEAFGKASFAVG